MLPIEILPLSSFFTAMAMSPIPVPIGALGSAMVIDFPGSSPATEVAYIAWDGLGREAANSEKRGLPLSLPAVGDVLLENTTVNLRVGGTRFVWIPAEAIGADLGGIFPGKTDAILWLVGK